MKLARDLGYIGLENTGWIIQLRNRTAHQIEKELAQLLMTERYKDKHEYFYWAPLLLFCYGKSVEELAAEEEMGFTIDQTSDDDDA